MYTISDIIQTLEQFAPIALQESYDNCGLLTGNRAIVVSKVLISLDVTEEVVDEAIAEGCNLIVAHHPIVFKGLKKLTGANYVERTMIKAIKNDIAIYAIHTNLDNVAQGVNYKIAQKIGLEKVQALVQKENTLSKLVTFIPLNAVDGVAQAIHTAGAGQLGNYTHCSFRTEGKGTFFPNEKANPHIGKANHMEHVDEVKFETIFPTHLMNKIIAALKQHHPYEEPAYDILALTNTSAEIGSGAVGYLPKPMNAMDFLHYLKEKMNLSHIRHTPLPGKEIKKVALCGGSGSFLLLAAKAQGADVFISSDFKYHEFFDAEGKLLIADINHYEGEYFTKELIFEHLCQKFANIALVLSKINTNPISII